jgi:hypothetical protein
MCTRTYATKKRKTHFHRRLEGPGRTWATDATTPVSWLLVFSMGRRVRAFTSCCARSGASIDTQLCIVFSESLFLSRGIFICRHLVLFGSAPVLVEMYCISLHLSSIREGQARLVGAHRRYVCFAPQINESRCEGRTSCASCANAQCQIHL